jgi:hypothetical protein
VDTLTIPGDDECMLLLFNRIPWVEISGTTYRHGSVIILNSYLLPEFGIIRDILVIDTNDYYFVCEVMETIQLVSHYHAFEVATDVSHSNVNICKQSTLVDHTVLGLYTVNSTNFVSLKYHIVENLD